MGLLSPADFRAVYGFRRPESSLAGAPGLRSGLYLHPIPDDPGLRCCPSSLYTFPACLGRAWLGIAIFEGFPDFEQFCRASFPAGTQVFPQVRCVCHSATPAWLTYYALL